MKRPQHNATKAIRLRGILYRAERHQIAHSIAIEVRNGRCAVGEVRLVRRLFVVRIALLGFGGFVKEAHAKHLGAAAKDRIRIERAAVAFVHAEVCVVLRREISARASPVMSPTAMF